MEKAPPFSTLRDAEARRSRRGWWRRVDNASLVLALLSDGDAWVKGPIYLLPLFAGSPRSYRRGPLAYSQGDMT